MSNLETEQRRIEKELARLNCATEALFQLTTPSVYLDKQSVFETFLRAFPSLDGAPRTMAEFRQWSSGTEMLDTSAAAAASVVGVLLGTQPTFDIIGIARTLAPEDRVGFARSIEMGLRPWSAHDIPQVTGAVRAAVEEARSSAPGQREEMLRRALATGPDDSVARPFVEALSSRGAFDLLQEKLDAHHRAALSVWGEAPFLL